MKAQSTQTVIDLAIMASGSAEVAYQMAKANGISITDDIADQALTYSGEVVDRRIFDLYSANNIMPATAIAAEVDDFQIFDETFDETFE